MKLRCREEEYRKTCWGVFYEVDATALADVNWRDGHAGFCPANYLWRRGGCLFFNGREPTFLTINFRSEKWFVKVMNVKKFYFF